METQMDGLPTTKSRPSVLSAFDEKNPKYYCCFRRLHIRVSTFSSIFQYFSIHFSYFPSIFSLFLTSHYFSPFSPFSHFPSIFLHFSTIFLLIPSSCNKFQKATRIVSVALIGSVLAILLYSFSRPPTVMVCSWLITVYALGIYGTLIYAVFKEKRTFTVSFLVFEVGLFVDSYTKNSRDSEF